jgi:diguanylate cyclase (GGDEF)-like protein
MWIEDGQPMFGALIRDVSDRQAALRQLEHLAHCDTLTSLPNRNALSARLSSEIEATACSLLLLDLDGFKDVNDTLGHSTGDQLLAAVAARLSDVVQDGMVARLGGDEFAILVSGSADPLELDRIAETIFAALRPPFHLGGQLIFVGTSIGIATAPRDASTVEQLMSCADLALYSAKANGGNVRTFFARSMQDKSEQRRRLSTELRTGFARRELELWYQPQVALTATGHELCGVEALLRWRHPERGLVAPDTFIRVLEESSIADDVGQWIIEQACLDLAGWRNAGLAPLRVAINLFPAQLKTGRLFDVVASNLARQTLPAELFEVEITENTVLRDDNQFTRSLRKLRTAGVSVAFDDFGTGYASLSLLQKYPLTRIKIDRSFVARIDRSASDAAIVGALIGMAESLGLAVLAEGVETREQERALRQLGCGEAQGFLYGRAMQSSLIARTYGQTQERSLA